MLPYLVHIGLYVINTTRAGARKLTNLQTWLSGTSPDTWVKQATAVNVLFYNTALAIHGSVDPCGIYAVVLTPT